jgi:hypothetical protein
MPYGRGGLIGRHGPILPAGVPGTGALVMGCGLTAGPGEALEGPFLLDPGGNGVLRVFFRQRTGSGGNAAPRIETLSRSEQSRVSWLKNAFAVDSAGHFEPTAPQRLVVDRVCDEITRRHLTSPALLFLETCRPLNYVGSQAMQFFHPIVSLVTGSRDGYRHFAEFLEQRGSVDYLCRRLEDSEMERTRKKREAPTREKDAGVSQPGNERQHP